MMNTHKTLGENIIKHANSKSIYLLSRKKFIWGNIKPDCTPKYKRMKHYYDESIDMVIENIQYLSSLKLEDIYYKMTIGKFSEELGVICHFLCDFFCAPHYYRWEFKSTKAVKHHMLYEQKLAKLAKEYKPKPVIDTTITSDNVREFIVHLQKQYDGTLNCENDLAYSYYVCDSIINMILNCIFANEFKSNREKIAL